jgi:hypothetical protein
MEYVVRPREIIRRAVMCGLLTQEESESKKVQDAAQYEAESLAEYWPESEGSGPRT